MCMLKFICTYPELNHYQLKQNKQTPLNRSMGNVFPINMHATMHVYNGQSSVSITIFFYMSPFNRLYLTLKV